MSLGQVYRLAAGAFVLAMTALGIWVHPAFLWLALFVGANRRRSWCDPLLAPAGRGVDARLRQQPVLSQLAALARAGKDQEELAGQRDRPAGGLEVGPPLHGHAVAVDERPAVAQFHFGL